MTAPTVDPALIAQFLAFQAQQQAAQTQQVPAVAPSYTPQMPVTPGTQVQYAATAPGFPAAALPISAAPLPQIGSIDEFFEQSNGGGKGRPWRYCHETTRNPMLGATYWGIVAEPITKDHMKAATNPQTKEVQRRKDGSVRWQMWVPMLMVPIPGHEDGLGQLCVKSDLQTKLDAAMAGVGFTKKCPPPVGSFVQATLIGIRPIPGFSPQYIYEVVFRTAEDPWTIERRAEVDAAHAALTTQAPAAPSAPPAPPTNGDPAALVAWAQAMQAHLGTSTVASPPAAAPVIPPAVAMAPPPAAVVAPTPAAAPIVPPAAPPQAAPAPAAQAVPAPATPAAPPQQTTPAAPVAGIDMSQLADLTPEARELFLRLTAGKVAAPVG